MLEEKQPTNNYLQPQKEPSIDTTVPELDTFSFTNRRNVRPTHSQISKNGLSPKTVLALQQTIGNRAVMRLLEKRGIDKTVTPRPTAPAADTVERSVTQKLEDFKPQEPAQTLADLASPDNSIQRMVLPIADLEQYASLPAKYHNEKARKSAKAVTDNSDRLLQYKRNVVAVAPGVTSVSAHTKGKLSTKETPTSPLKQLGENEKLYIIGHGAQARDAKGEQHPAITAGGFEPKMLAKKLVFSGLPPKYKGQIYLVTCNSASGIAGSRYADIFKNALSTLGWDVPVKAVRGLSSLDQTGHVEVKHRGWEQLDNWREELFLRTKELIAYYEKTDRKFRLTNNMLDQINEQGHLSEDDQKRRNALREESEQLNTKRHNIAAEAGRIREIINELDNKLGSPRDKNRKVLLPRNLPAGMPNQAELTSGLENDAKLRNYNVTQFKKANIDQEP